jgi:hypothetical protein
VEWCLPGQRVAAARGPGSGTDGGRGSRGVRSMEPIRSLALLGWLMTLCFSVQADAYRAQGSGFSERRAERVPLSVFYRLDAAGKPVRENPVRSGFALDSTASYEPPQPGRQGRAAPVIVVTPDRPRTSIRIEIPVRPDRRSFDGAFRAFRCERHGFFFTSEGRCVVPAFGRRMVPRARPQPRQRSAPIGTLPD